MARIEKTVFISYRRANGIWARAIYQELTAHGYDAFFDFQSINSGDFSQVILQNIKARAHFVLLLTPTALERCNEPGDWLRREIETAMDCKRNIVPVMLEEFDIGSPASTQYLTGKLALLKSYSGLRIYADYFEEGLARLRERYLNVALEAVLHPVSASVKKVTDEQNRAAKSEPPVKQKELSAQEWFTKGYQSTDLDEQIRCYTEAIRLKPDYSQAYNNRGITFIILKDYPAALADYNRAIELDPKNAKPVYNKACFYGLQGNVELACDWLRRAINMDKKYIKLGCEDSDLDAIRESYEFQALLKEFGGADRGDR